MDLTADGKRSLQISPLDLHPFITDPVSNGMTLLNEIAGRYPEAVSFAPGWPPEDGCEVGDIDRYIRRYAEYLKSVGRDERDIRRQLFQYGPSAGYIGDLIARYLASEEGIAVESRAILVTVGCQEALAVAVRALCTGPNDALLVPEPCYFGVVGAARILGIRVVRVPETQVGLDAGRVAEVCAQVRSAGGRPRALYVIPDFSNPSGSLLSARGRQLLLNTAEEEDLLVLEDTPYRIFTRPENQLPTLKSLDLNGRVIYIGSFAKTFFPGARLGFLVADQKVGAPNGKHVYLAQALEKIKSNLTINTPSVTQAIAGGFLLANQFDIRTACNDRVQAVLTRMQALLTALDKHLEGCRDVTWNKPLGGFFVALTVPFRVDLDSLEECAARFGVLWSPMSLFYEGSSNGIRLSPSYLQPDRIDLGVRHLADFVKHRSGLFR
jgi:(S)-3,5-dihydroxyphenylglycine transaminase